MNNLERVVQHFFLLAHPHNVLPQKVAQSTAVSNAGMQVIQFCIRRVDFYLLAVRRPGDDTELEIVLNELNV